jgi:hypothetical protein
MVAESSSSDKAVTVESLIGDYLVRSRIVPIILYEEPPRVYIEVADDI